MLVLRPGAQLSAEFLFYRLVSADFIDLVNSTTFGSKMPRADWEQIGNIPLAFPRLAEQANIVSLVDCKTAEIDQLLAKKQRLIGLLDEKRNALISRAITKGLDPNVPMKDSGAEWLGEVPVEWEVKRLGQIVESIQTGPFGSQLHVEDYIDGGVPVINPSDLTDGSISPEGAATVSDDTARRLSRHRLREGDIVLARRGEMGRCGLTTTLEENWLCGTGSARVRPAQSQLLGAFLRFVLGLRGCKEQLELASVGATMDNLNARIIGRLIVPVPPISLQEPIVTKCVAVNFQTKNLQDRVTAVSRRLREYRSALITAAVTGQLDLRQYEKKMEVLA